LVGIPRDWRSVPPLKRLVAILKDSITLNVEFKQNYFEIINSSILYTFGVFMDYRTSVTPNSG